MFDKPKEKGFIKIITKQFSKKQKRENRPR